MRSATPLPPLRPAAPRQPWPSAADPAAAARFAEHFAAIGRFEARLAASPGGAAMLAAIGGNSPYLAESALADSAAVLRFAAEGPDPVLQAALAELEAVPPTLPRARIAALLRQVKRRAALVIALADIGGLWRLARITAALSALAEATLETALAHLLADSAPMFGPPLRAQLRGFVILGMGKLGARELNFSSDVDLVVLYDPAEDDARAAVAVRVARALVGLMQDRTEDGYVFRTDLRLRPDPGATAPAVSLPAALAYYESMGQTWERAAMLKARPVAGDLALGAAFLDAIRPFVWRRHLDFAAIADIHAMKRRIDAQATPRRPEPKGPAKGPAKGQAPRDAAGPGRLAGHNLKLGRGGIREIEFIAQTLQLVWGGRDPSLRAPATLAALAALARAGHLPPRAAAELARAYRFLRSAEHRLQMVADRQTHALPEATDALARFAIFLGYAGVGPMAAALRRHLDAVGRHWAALFDALPPPPAAATRLYFDGPDDSPATLDTLAAMGFRDPGAIAAAVRSWQAGRVRALRSLRARELMGATLPHLLAALARQPDADLAFARFAGFLDHLPAGVQPLSLFERNPALLERVVAVLGAAPALADYLARVPSALDGLIAPEVPAASVRLLRRRVAEAGEFEAVLTALAHGVREQEFALAVASMEGRLDVDSAGRARTALADAVLAALLPRVLANHAARHGHVRGGAMVVVALGKAGSREMLAGSDLDLMLVYDHPEAVTESRVRRGDRARALPVSQWFIRAAHAFIAALTAPSAEGALYAVDMRLRPSGNKGPVAVSLASFERYHASSAWTWERMALTRARVVSGPRGLSQRVEAAITAALARHEPAASIRADAAAMRARLARDAPPAGPWDVKLRPGGLMEVEFIVQVLQLIHVQVNPASAHPTTAEALTRLEAAGAIGAADAARLRRADFVWRTVQEMLRITLGRMPRADLPEPTRAAIARALELAVPARLEATLDELAASVRAAFTRLVGPPEVAGDQT